MVKFLERHKPRPGETADNPQFDIHKYEAIGLPDNYQFPNVVSQTVYMRSTDEGATWKEVLRSTEKEVGRGPDSGCYTPVQIPDGRLMSVSWGMPGYLRSSRDDGKTWQPVRELMDGKYFDQAPFVVRLLSDNKTLAIYCPYTHAWGEGKEFPGRLYSRPGVGNSWHATMLFSSDFGKTFTDPVQVLPGVPCTEADFCEMPSGDLLLMQNRLFDNGVAHRQLLRKTKFGYVPEDMEIVDPKAPEIFVRTKEGYLVGASRNDAYVWSDDDGLNWYPLQGIPSCGYQPRAILLPDDRIMFAWHAGGDLFYGQADEYIGEQIFKLDVQHAKQRTDLKLSRVYDESQRKYICAFDAVLTATDGKPIANKPVEISWVARGAAGYEPFGGATPWVHGDKQIAKTNDQGVARFDLRDQEKATSIHQTYQIAARFDPDRKDDQFLPSTSLMLEYYALTMNADGK
jgi:hypothetical protein